MLGIACSDLKAGEKLPSTSEIARRFHVHANTVRAVYRDLVEGRWVEWRRGSGFYVRKRKPVERSATDGLDSLVAAFMEMAVGAGYALEEIRQHVSAWVGMRPPDHTLVIEPDSELRAILVSEIAQATGARTEGAGMEACAEPARLAGALAAALPDHAESARAALPAHAPLLMLQSRSIAASLAGQCRPPADTPITVVSSWPDFLRWAHMVLTGVGLDPAAFDIRDCRNNGWKRGLGPHSFIVVDSLSVT